MSVPEIQSEVEIKQEKLTESEFYQYSDVEVIENPDPDDAIICISDSDEGSDELLASTSNYVSNNDDVFAELQRRNQANEASQVRVPTDSENLLLGQMEESSPGNKCVDDFLIIFYNRFFFDCSSSKLVSINISNPSSKRSLDIAIYSRLRRVEYHKDKVPKFQLFVDLPEFDLFSVAIKNENIRNYLDLHEQQWDSLNFLLDLQNNYELECRPGSLQQKCTTLLKNSVGDFKDILDQYFQTLPQLKPFYFRNSLDSLICYNGDCVPLERANVAEFLDPDILEMIRRNIGDC